MTPSWRQLNVRFPDWGTVEEAALTRLRPALTEAEEAGLIDTWFFMRKTEPPGPHERNSLAAHETARRRPCWRVRILPPDESATTDALALIHKHTPSTTPGLYESEVHAFGGDTGMALAHTLFHQDSRHLLAYLDLLRTDAPAAVGRAELAVLLCSRLFRAAGQDWYEQGDIWARIAQHRRPADELPPERLGALQPAVRRLMTVDTVDLARDTHSGLSFATGWFTAFDHAGERLAQLARDGALQRGLRAVLAHHVLFAFNRWGLTPTTQTLLAHTATTLVFD